MPNSGRETEHVCGKRFEAGLGTLRVFFCFWKIHLASGFMRRASLGSFDWIHSLVPESFLHRGSASREMVCALQPTERPPPDADGFKLTMHITHRWRLDILILGTVQDEIPRPLKQ